MLQSMGSGRVGHDLMAKQQQHDGRRDGCNELSNGGSSFEIVEATKLLASTIISLNFGPMKGGN